MEAEIVKCKKSSSVLEAQLQEKVQTLADEIQKIEKTREKEKASAQQKIVRNLLIWVL